MLRAPLLLAIPILLTVQGCRDLSGVDTGEAELTEQGEVDVCAGAVTGQHPAEPREEKGEAWRHEKRGWRAA